MDAYEATRNVFSRIQTLDPENASKIMGLLLIQDYGEKEMIRLAFGPEDLLHSVVVKTRSELGLVGLPSDPTSAPPSPTSPSPFLSRHNSSTPSRLFGGGGGRGFSLPPSLAIPPTPPSWEQPSMFSDFPNSEELSPAGTFRPHSKTSSSDLLDDFRFQGQLSFVSDYCSPTTRHREMLAATSFPGYGGEAAGNWGGVHHRRSCSVNDACFAADDLTSSFGWKPCLYYSRGFCKNGSSCRFLHGCGFESPSGMALPGSDFPMKPDLMEQYPEMLGCKYSPRAAAAAALMSAEDMNKYGRFRMECAAGMMSPSSRQIYLTFPADSTFREEDVSNYFSIYGPVQDVRIPYQQKRMFGFVSFVYAETVRIILAKGNPHFVCDARVLVKPYKEKGKVPDKKQQQQMERFDQFSACGSPTGLDSRDPRDFQLGGRMVYGNQQEMLWRRKMEEQADIHQAIEFNTRRLSSLQLHCHPSLNSFTAAQSQTSTEIPQDSCFSPGSVSGGLQKTASVGCEKESSDFQNGIAAGKVDFPPEDGGDSKKESLEHILPDHLFSSPKKSGDDHASVFSDGLIDHGEANKIEAELNTAEPSSSSAPSVPITSSSLLLAGSTLGMASLKSCYYPIPSFSPSQETVGV